jgi:hypothetical protein
MRLRFLQPILLAGLASGSSAAPLFTLNLYDSAKFPLASALDGSQGGYYIRPAGSPQAAKKYKVFFQGGGWCVSDADCYARSKTTLGSSAGLPPTTPVPDPPGGYCGGSFLSADPSLNPTTYDWTAVYVPYTDGSSFTGSVEAPVQINATASVYYRGAWQRNALIAALAADQGLAQATDVVFGGCSAGGLTIYLNIDYLASSTRAVAPSARVHGLADAGFFLDHNNIYNQPSRTPLFQWGFSAWNASAALDGRCLAAYAAAPWHCIFAQYTSRFIDTPVFLLNSKYDSCQLGNCELGIPGSQFAHGWNVRAPSKITRLAPLCCPA